jgi:tetratricopeptide (TPR) repeat protein
LHINLGLIAEKAGRLPDAARYYERAISILDGMGGESDLQCAHAHYNIARILRALGNTRYKEFARKAIARYQASPLASPSDIKDAEKILKSGKTLRVLLLVALLVVIAVAAWFVFF